MRTLTLIALALTAVALVLSGCTTAYWDRPGAALSSLASEAEACYQTALNADTSAAASPATGTPERLLRRSEPPPALWNRSPREAGFEHFDEQLRYERCMRRRGWEPVRVSAPRP